MVTEVMVVELIKVEVVVTVTIVAAVELVAIYVTLIGPSHQIIVVTYSEGPGQVFLLVLL